LGKKIKNLDIFKYGSTWLKADFHLHTKADKEFEYLLEESYYYSTYVEKLKKNNIKLGVICNHNKFDFDEFKALRKTAMGQEIYLLAGVELSVGDGANGIHAIIVFSDEWIENNQNYINQFLTSSFVGKTPNTYENENGRSSDNIIETIKRLEEFKKDFFIVFAHVEESKGLWKELDGGRLAELGKNELFRSRTLGFQKVRTHDKSEKCRLKVKNWIGEVNYPAEVEGSDCKNIDCVGKIDGCYLKIGDFTFEAVKYALSDYTSRVSTLIPKRSKSYIESILFEGGILSKQELDFSSGLNTLIGIRGSGKSSIVETLRYALDIKFGEKAQDYEYKKELIKHTLGSGGKVTVNAVDRFGQKYEIRRILNEKPEVFVGGILQPGVAIKETIIYKPVYFGQKDLSSSGEGFEKDLVEKILGDRVVNIRKQIEEQKVIVQEAVRKYKKISNISDQIKEYEDKKTNAEHRLKQYKNYKIEEKLQKQLDFDNDARKCSNITSTVKEFIDALNGILTEFEDDIKNHRNYKSKQNETFFLELYKLYEQIINAVDGLKKILHDSEKSYKEIIGKEKDFEKIKENFKEEFAEIKRKLAESLNTSGAQAIKPDEFMQMSKILEQSKAMLIELEKEQSRANFVKDDLTKALSDLNKLWHDEFTLIQTELKKINSNNTSLSIENEYKGDKESWIRFMKENFKGSNLRETIYKKISDQYQDFHEIFKSPDKAKEMLENSWIVFEEYFNKGLEIFLIWQKPNRFLIKYRGKELKEHSLGQRASALILFVLSQKDNDVIIIDQPEDDLDNQTIYQDVIKLLKLLKNETQFIFATHNPNIPVLGDAEQILSCEYSTDVILLQQGSIDDPEMQNVIVSVMEGGEEAFNKRKEIYQIWKPQNSSK
jgi:predicted ATPase